MKFDTVLAKKHFYVLLKETPCTIEYSSLYDNISHSIQSHCLHECSVNEGYVLTGIDNILFLHLNLVLRIIVSLHIVSEYMYVDCRYTFVFSYKNINIAITFIFFFTEQIECHAPCLSQINVLCLISCCSVNVYNVFFFYMLHELFMLLYIIFSDVLFSFISFHHINLIGLKTPNGKLCQ